LAGSAALAATVLAGGLARAADPAPPPPVPGSPGLYTSAQTLADGLTQAKKKNTDLATSNLGLTQTYSIHQVYRGKAAPPAIHPGWTELHFVLDGSATFVTGGSIKGTGPTAVVEGGTSQKIAKGDAVIVPPNTPHWYQSVDGSITYLEVRFVSPTAP
jgi:mannose-6-phosphate isomerase-like protein (cupin superfamily)